MSEFQLSPEDVEHFASGVMPHERPTTVEVYTEELRKTVVALGLAHPYDADYNEAITDVLEVLDDEDA